MKLLTKRLITSIAVSLSYRIWFERSNRYLEPFHAGGFLLPALPYMVPNI